MGIASREDVIPIGLLYQNTERFRLEEMSSVGANMTVAEKLSALDQELDRFAI